MMEAFGAQSTQTILCPDGSRFEASTDLPYSEALKQCPGSAPAAFAPVPGAGNFQTVSSAQSPSGFTSAPGASSASTWADLANSLAQLGVQQMTAKQQNAYQLALAKINAGQGHLPVVAGGPARSSYTWIAPVLIGAAALGVLWYFAKKR